MAEVAGDRPRKGEREYSEQVKAIQRAFDAQHLTTLALIKSERSREGTPTSTSCVVYSFEHAQADPWIGPHKAVGDTRVGDTIFCAKYTSSFKQNDLLNSSSLKANLPEFSFSDQFFTDSLQAAGLGTLLSSESGTCFVLGGGPLATSSEGSAFFPTPLEQSNGVVAAILKAVSETKEASAEGASSAARTDERMALLAEAAKAAQAMSYSTINLEQQALREAVELLGGSAVIGLAVTSESELLQALSIGFPGQVLRALQIAGYPHAILEQVIAPRRTLMRRRAEGQRLTRGESDAAWRLAFILALASRVLNGPKAALAWLARPKAKFHDQTPIDLLETSVGTSAVEKLLQQLEWGDVA